MGGRSHSTYIQMTVNLSLLEADFPIEKNFCQRQDKFLYGFHGNNHTPPHQVSLFNFKNLMREVTINKEFSL